MHANTDAMECGRATGAYTLTTTTEFQGGGMDVNGDRITELVKNVCKQHGKMLWKYLGFQEEEKSNVHTLAYMREHSEKMDAMEKGRAFMSASHYILPIHDE